MRQQVNLLTPELLPKPERLSLRQLLAVWGVFCAVLTALSAYSGWRQWALEEELAALQSRSQALEGGNQRLEAELLELPDAVLAAQVADLARQARQRQQLLEALHDETPRQSAGVAGVLGDLARYRVPDLWYDGIRVEHGGRSLALEGRTLDPARVPELLKTLRQTGHIAGRRFERLELEQHPDGGVRFLLASAEASPQ